VWSVCLSVRWVHGPAAQKNVWNDRDAIWGADSRNHVLDRCPDPYTRRDTFDMPAHCNVSSTGECACPAHGGWMHSPLWHVSNAASCQITLNTCDNRLSMSSSFGWFFSCLVKRAFPHITVFWFYFTVFFQLSKCPYLPCLLIDAVCGRQK